MELFGIDRGPHKHRSTPKDALPTDGAAMRCKDGGAKRVWAPLSGLTWAQNKVDFPCARPGSSLDGVTSTTV
jgi:hypothetical protein